MKEYWKEAKDILFGIRDDIIESGGYSKCFDLSNIL